MDSLSAVVVGAGPAGCLMSIILANRGFAVDLVERIPDYDALSEKKTFTYVLTVRALKALKYAGVELPKEVGLKLSTVSMYKDGNFFTRPYTPSRPKYSAGRTDLTKYLLNEARNHKSGKVKVHLGWTFYALEEEGQVARFRRTPSKTEEIEHSLISGSFSMMEGPENQLDLKDYDLLVGADGAHSVTRAEMSRVDAEIGGPKHQRLTYFQRECPSKYKRLPPITMERMKESSLSPNLDGVVAFPGTSGSSFLGVPKPDGYFYNVFIIPENRRFRTINFSNSEDVTSFMEHEFPELWKLYTCDDPNFADTFAKEPLIPGGVSTYCTRYHTGRGVLIGDAAHSMYPTFGQGLNSAFEDCVVLDQALEKTLKNGGKDLPKALAVYSAERKPDIHTIVKLSEDAPLPISTKSVLSTLQLMFRVTVLSLAGKVVPSWGPKAIMPDDDLPYADFKAQLDRENQRALLLFSGSVLCIGLAVVAGSKLYSKISKKVK